MASDKEPPLRRSAGMRGMPRNDAPEHRPISNTPPKRRPEIADPERVSTSRYPKPKVLMGEVVGPRAKETGKAEIGKQRDAFRAFMVAKHLSPTGWARAAGIPTGEILGFLTGKSRGIAAQSLEKLARAAGCAPEEFFR